LRLYFFLSLPRIGFSDDYSASLTKRESGENPEQTRYCELLSQEPANAK
jgi:hypothetical protein